jgi:hypothetical protein
MEIKVKREVKERLKGTMEELVSEPQKLRALSSKIKEPEETVVKTDFDIILPPLNPTPHPLVKSPEIKPMQFILSTPRTDFDIAILEIKTPPTPLTVPKLSVEELHEIITRNYFDKTIFPEVISKIEMVEEAKEKGELKKRRVTSEKTTAEISEIPKSLPEEFNDILEYEEKWITSGEGAMPSNAHLFYVQGLKGMGFEVLKGLLRLELLDRGRKSRPEWMNSGDLKAKNNREKISDDHRDYFNFIYIEDHPQTWTNWFEKSGEVNDVKKEVDKSLKKKIFKYILFANQLTQDKVGESQTLEEIKNQFDGVRDKFKKHFSINREINLKYCLEGCKNASELGFEVIDIKTLQGVAEIFASILQVNKGDFNVEREIISNRETLDSIWERLESQKGEKSAITMLLNKYASPKYKFILDYLPPDAKQENESKEHFVIKQLVIKELFRIGKKKWQIDEVDGRDYFTEWKLKEVENEVNPEKIEVESLKYKLDKDGQRVPIKRPDITVRTKDDKIIWVEVETCKNIDLPLPSVMDKLRKIILVEENERPDELWVVFPYRKYFIYGKEEFEEVRKFFMKWFKDLKKFKPRIFFSDLYEERLHELKQNRVKKLK